MTTNINADNGVVSGIPGLKTSADNSGVLALQTNGTTALTVNASQALGVGSTPSYGTSGQVLTSAGSGAPPTWSSAGGSSQWTTSGSNIYYTTGNVGIGTASPSGILQVNGVQDGVANKNARFSYNGTYYLEINELSIRSFNNPLIFGTGTSGTERMQIDASGNVGIGTSSPAAKLHVASGGLQYGSATDYLKLVQTNTNEFGFLCNPLGNYSFNFNTSTGGVKVLNTLGVGNATPSTSGAGITFPATQSASSNANTLDDYEEGTWIPSLGGTTTYQDRKASYVKIGKLVYVQGYIVVNTIGTGSATLLSGLPFSAETDCYGSGSSSYFASIATSIVFITPYVYNNQPTSIQFRTLTAAGTTTANANIFQNGTTVYFALCYTTT